LSANPATSDEVLIGRIANGDRLAMQVLFARHHVRVFRFVLRLVRNDATAEDLDEETAEAIEDTSDIPDVTLEKKQKADIIRKCLSGLSNEHREIVDLVYYHEKSVEEVAEIVGIPEATVKTRMFYARKKLAELLKAQGIERGWP
jgi:RNA polymerase sigma-70 factor (ECF subfamily)